MPETYTILDHLIPDTIFPDLIEDCVHVIMFVDTKVIGQTDIKR